MSNSSSETLENSTVINAGEHICHSDCSEYSDNEAEQTSALIRNPRRMEARNDHQRYRQFGMLHRFNLFIGALLVALVAVWCTNSRGGFAWTSNIHLQFNWHPMLMTLGMIFTFSQSMLIYRAKRRLSKKTLKWTHATLHGFTFICTVIGLKAVFDSHNYAEPPIANLYSMHSWIGLTAVIIFAFQYVFGFVTFLWPGMRQELRKFSLPIHVATGTACFFFGVCAAFMGFTEKAFFVFDKKYGDLAGEAILVNFISLLLAIFGALSLYLVNNPDYKREAEGEDHIVITEHTE